MKKEDAEEFTQSLGQIVGGAIRQITLADRLGVPRALGMKLPEWVDKYLGGYAKLKKEERIKQIAEWKKEEPDLSNRQAAGRLGVDEGTVRGDLTAENSAVVPSLSRSSETNAAEHSAPPAATTAQKAKDTRDARHSNGSRSEPLRDAPATLADLGVDLGFAA